MANFSDTAQHGGVKIACAAPATNTDWHVFEDHEIAFMSESFSIHAAFFHRPVAMFALEIVHGSNQLENFDAVR